MTITLPSMPPLVKQANQLPYRYADGNGIEFEPFADFLSREETRSWIRAWTGNWSLEGDEFLIFGQDGTGGYAAFWCVHPNEPILKQPIVFLGSEGEMGVVASSFTNYLWLLAAGLGPCEAISIPDEPRIEQPPLAEFAKVHALPYRAPYEVLSEARAEFPDFEERMLAVCK